MMTIREKNRARARRMFFPEPVVSKNTNGLKIHVTGRFGLEVPRLGSPREARILGRYGVAADGPEPPLAVWTADVPPLPDLTVTPSAGSPVRTRPPQT